MWGLGQGWDWRKTSFSFYHRPSHQEAWKLNYPLHTPPSPLYPTFWNMVTIDHVMFHQLAFSGNLCFCFAWAGSFILSLQAFLCQHLSPVWESLSSSVTLLLGIPFPMSREEFFPFPWRQRACILQESQLSELQRPSQALTNLPSTWDGAA